MDHQLSQLRIFSYLGERCNVMLRVGSAIKERLLSAFFINELENKFRSRLFFPYGQAKRTASLFLFADLAPARHYSWMFVA
jgi:hypothetical protein